MSVTYNQCSHKRIRHSEDGFSVIEECPECCKAWLVQGITGEIIRLYGSIELRLTKAKAARIIEESK